MPFSVVERDASIDASAGRMTHLTLYQAEGAGAEVGEMVRVAVSGWTKAADGARSLTSPVDITVPAASTFDHVVLMDALTGGTVRGYIPVALSSFGEQGIYTVSSATISLPAA
jgi:hypothetical protein